MVPVWMIFSDLFKVTIIQRQLTWKWYNIQLYLQWPTNRKSNGAIFNDLKRPLPRVSRSRHFLTLNVRKGTTYRHSFNEMLIRNLHTPDSTVSFWMILTDLAKYSMTRSFARSLCDSWASCMESRVKSKQFMSLPKLFDSWLLHVL